MKDLITSARHNVDKNTPYDRAIHKNVRDKCPESAKGKFTNRDKISKWKIRRMNDLQIPNPRLDISKMRFS